MDKRFHFKPYTFRNRLMLFLLLVSIAMCTVSAIGGYVMNLTTQNTELKNQEQEVAVYLLGLAQKTDLSTEEMLSMVSNNTLEAAILPDADKALTRAVLKDLEAGGVHVSGHSLTSMPSTYLKLREDVIRIRPTRDFNRFLYLLPRALFTLALSAILFGLVSVLVGFHFSKPITQLTKATTKVKEGDFTVRLPEDIHGEVGELMRSFNSMTEELSRTEYLQKDFISSISHEFRTPIASIKGFARLLQMPGLDEAARQEYVGLIAQESDRLSRLSDALLRLSALERQQAPASLSTFRLDEQVRQVILQLEPVWATRDIDWQLDLDPVTIESDAELLTQVWINLIQNAVKFSPESSTISIRIAKGDKAVFTITDQGVGMDDATIARIFDRFYQGDTSRSKQGVGLGLCLVKRILDMLSGSIHVTSTVGEGSTFRVSLPLKQGGHHEQLP